MATKLGDPSGVRSQARAAQLGPAHSPLEREGWWAGLGVGFRRGFGGLGGLGGLRGLRGFRGFRGLEGFRV